MQTQYFLYHIQILLPLRLKFLFYNRDTCFGSRCNFLFKSFLIKRDQISCMTDNFCPGTIIRIQNYFPCIRIVFCEIQHNLRSGTTKSVNRLIIVPDNKQIVLRCCQHTNNIILDLIILIFPLPRRQNIRALYQQFFTIHQHVIKIYETVLMQEIFISFKYISKDILPTAGRIVMCQIYRSVFYQTDF